MAVQIVLLPDPYTMDWQPWADTVAGYNPGLIDHVDPTEGWQEYARRLCEAVPEAPQPDAHAFWQSWALALKMTLQV